MYTIYKNIVEQGEIISTPYKICKTKLGAKILTIRLNRELNKWYRTLNYVKFDTEACSFKDFLIEISNNKYGEDILNMANFTYK